MENDISHPVPAANAPRNAPSFRPFRAFPWLTLALSLPMGSAAFAEGFTLTSPSAPDGVLREDQVLSEAYGFGCAGGNIAPALDWSGAPAGTESFVLRIHDPDAPTGIGGWTHWVVANIPASASGIAAGEALPEGSLETLTDFGRPGYGGACPPEGSNHRYVVTLDAMPVAALPAEVITAQSMPALVGFVTGGASLGQASLTLTYGR